MSNADSVSIINLNFLQGQPGMIMQEEFDEKLIIRKVLSGDQKAFVRLIHQYEGLVLHIVTPLIGINEDREDICQDVFIKVYEKLSTFQFRSKLSTWIGNIAYNSCMNFLKKKKPITQSALTTSVEELMDNLKVDIENAEQIMIKAEEVNDLVRCIDQLSEIQKTILLLFYHEELSLEDISSITDIPVNTVKSHLFRARTSLKQLIRL